MNLDSILNVIFFAIGLALGLLQLYLAQHQFEVQQREKMDELRKILTEIQQRLAVIEEATSDRVFDVQDKLIHLISGTQAIEKFTDETSKEIRNLVESELKAVGIQESIQRTKKLEQQLSRILERSASTLVESATAEPEDLTIREAEVLKLLLDGYTDSEIARMLNISLMTVKVYVAALLQKFDASTRTQVVLKYMRAKQNSNPSAPGSERNAS